MGVVTADVLYERGFYSIEELANATVEELTQIKGIGETKAQSLIEGVQQMLVAKQSDAKLKEDESDLSEGQVDDQKNAEQSEISNNITASSEDA